MNINELKKVRESVEETSDESRAVHSFWNGSERASFIRHMQTEERAASAIERYTEEVERFCRFVGGRALSKELVLAYKQRLRESCRRASTVNVKLSAVNYYLRYPGLKAYCARLLRIQRRLFAERERELQRAEYQRLLQTCSAQGKERLYHILLTLFATGMRVSELRSLTVEALKRGRVEISLKGKTRVIILQTRLQKKLRAYIKKAGVSCGAVFCTRSGRALDRSNICHEMKRLSQSCGLSSGKLHPHSLRHLFARCFYEAHKNIAYLANILGHSSIETTRIYVAVSEQEHLKMLDSLRLQL